MTKMDLLAQKTKKFLGRRVSDTEYVRMTGVDDGEFICMVIVHTKRFGEIVYYVKSPEKVQEYMFDKDKFRYLPWAQAKHVYAFVVDVVTISEYIDTFYWNLQSGQMKVLWSDTNQESVGVVVP